MTEDFWTRCIVAGCFVAPFKLYSQDHRGTYYEKDFIGIRYAALPLETQTNFDYDDEQSEMYVELEYSRYVTLQLTPEAALEAFEKGCSI